jgi:hypothetical protein
VVRQAPAVVENLDSGHCAVTITRGNVATAEDVCFIMRNQRADSSPMSGMMHAAGALQVSVASIV